ncbi:MAG: hypothetical protein ABIP06_02880 [Pyrinomonadaceae bacterium]
MNKINRLILVTAACFLFLSFFGVSQVKAQPGATFDRMWIDYNIKENNQDGMRIHIKFTANSLKSADCQIRISFFDDDEKTPLTDNNQRFYTTKGNVALFRDLKPPYDPAVYEDFQMFMPYDELDLSYGSYKLKMDVDLIYKDGELIEHMNWYPFVYDKKAPASATKPLVEFDRMWIEYDVTEGGQFGMRIHSKFTIKGMKDVKGYLVFFFERENGTRLKSYDNKFQSKGNDVALYKEITPGYDPTVYKDYYGFIPYSELHLTKGEHNLKIDADIIYENGDFIQHLGFEKFRYWKQ